MREIKIDVDTNNENFTFFKFHGGEVQVKLSLKDNAIDQFIVFSRLADSDAIMRVLLTKNAIENYCRENDIPCKYIFLVAPYLPYARQDRICSVGEAHSLKVVASLINSAKFDRVYVFDVHSDVSLALVDNIVNMSANTMIEKAVAAIKVSNEHLYIISPDAGANKKVNKVYDHLLKTYSLSGLIKCDKTRNPTTGDLSGFAVLADSLEEKPCLIVDDICSKGGTFIGLAKELKAKNAGDIYLYISHYEGVADIDSMKEAGIKGIYCTNSILFEPNPFITVVKDFSITTN